MFHFISGYTSVKTPKRPKTLKKPHYKRKAGARVWVYQSKIDKTYKKDCNYTKTQQKLHDQESLSLNWTLLCCPLLHSLDYKIIALLLQIYNISMSCLHCFQIQALWHNKKVKIRQIQDVSTTNILFKVIVGPQRQRLL